MSKLPDLPSASNKSFKRLKRKSHEFWNQELQELWAERCNKERLYSKYTCRTQLDLNQKQILKEQFKSAQKTFDKKVQTF